jgi:hypothetical protein
MYSLSPVHVTISTIYPNTIGINHNVPLYTAPPILWLIFVTYKKAHYLFRELITFKGFPKQCRTTIKIRKYVPGN